MSRANTSEYVGASVVVGPVRAKLLLSDKSLRLVPRPGVRSEWLWRALQAPSARRQISAFATGTKESMRNISQASLLQVRVPDLKPAAQERALSQFASVKTASDRLHGEVLDQVKRLSVLRRALLTEAFSGRLMQGESGLVAAEMNSA